ncbi:MAG: FKBP-type peptidyl-prolyl cis-trans isomerase, partial [Pseudomonadota bacterium]
MWKYSIGAAAATFILAACGGGAEQVDKNDPFATLYPWDESREGVEIIAEDLTYYEIESGPETAPKAELGDTVIVLTEGRVANTGEVFDDTFSSGFPQVVGVGGVQAGLSRAFQVMSEGDDWMVFIPNNLAFGMSPPPNINVLPGDDLLYHIKMLQVIKAEPSDADAWSQYLPWNSEAENVTTTESGLQFITLEDGKAGGKIPTRNGGVVAFYEGRLSETGEVFDSAFQRGSPLAFGVTRVIPGWTEMLQLMSE